MRVRQAGNLRQMSDAQDLPVRAQFLQASSDHFGNAAADTAVDLIEDHARNRAAVAGNYLDGEAHARQLATGGDSCKWLATAGRDSR